MARLPWQRSRARTGGQPHAAHRPGSRAYAHLEGNVVHRIPARAGQEIRRGDIVTQEGGRLARVCSAAGAGEGMNWGDVSAGAYVALGPTGATGTPWEGHVPVYTYGARVEVMLDAGISAGSRVGVDLRGLAGGRRAGRSAPVDMSTPRDSDAALWQRVRAMSPGDIEDAVRRKALLGTVVRVLSGGAARSAGSPEGDIGAVVIETQA